MGAIAAGATGYRRTGVVRRAGTNLRACRSPAPSVGISPVIRRGGSNQGTPPGLGPASVLQLLVFLEADDDGGGRSVVREGTGLVAVHGAPCDLVPAVAGLRDRDLVHGRFLRSARLVKHGFAGAGTSWRRGPLRVRGCAAKLTAEGIMADMRRWRTWDERIDEDQVSVEREGMRAEPRAFRLAQIRRRPGLTRADVVAAMHVSRRRVSAVERGGLSRAELGRGHVHRGDRGQGGDRRRLR